MGPKPLTLNSKLETVDLLTFIPSRRKNWKAKPLFLASAHDHLHGPGIPGKNIDLDIDFDIDGNIDFDRMLQICQLDHLGSHTSRNKQKQAETSRNQQVLQHLYREQQLTATQTTQHSEPTCSCLLWPSCLGLEKFKQQLHIWFHIWFGKVLNSILLLELENLLPQP